MTETRPLAPPTTDSQLETGELSSALELAPVYDVAIRTLRLGFLLVAALFTAGLVWSAVEGEDIAEEVIPIADVPGQLADGKPMAAVVLGFLVLMFTPVATVLGIGVTFMRLGDRRYGLLSFGVLAILAASLVLALVR